MSDDPNQERKIGIPGALSGLFLWIIALGGLIGSASDPAYLIASAIASGFLFHRFS